MSTVLLHRALYGEPKPITPRGQALWHCRALRATRAWLTPGSYGWCRYTDHLKAAQRRLQEMRPQTKEAGASDA